VAEVVSAEENFFTHTDNTKFPAPDSRSYIRPPGSPVSPKKQKEKVKSANENA
jgi:hypothetical protein